MLDKNSPHLCSYGVWIVIGVTTATMGVISVVGAIGWALLKMAGVI